MERARELAIGCVSLREPRVFFKESAGIAAAASCREVPVERVDAAMAVGA